VTKPVVVGHSMGGAIALDLAARHPELPSAIVLVDAAPIVRSPELTGMLEGLVTSLRGDDHLAVRRGFIEQLLFADTDDPVRKARIIDDMLAAPQHVAAGCFNGMLGWDGEAAARAITVPALHIAADQPINDSTALRALNPLIRTAQTVGAGHFNQLEAAPQVNAMIEQFLRVSTAGAR